MIAGPHEGLQGKMYRASQYHCIKISRVLESVATFSQKSQLQRNGMWSGRSTSAARKLAYHGWPLTTPTTGHWIILCHLYPLLAKLLCYRAKALLFRGLTNHWSLFQYNRLRQSYCKAFLDQVDKGLQRPTFIGVCFLFFKS